MDGHQIQTAKQALDFLLAGRAVVTLRSKRTGNHLTFKVKKATRATTNVTHFVSHRTGGVGKNAYAYMGYIDAERRFWLGSAAKTPYRAADVQPKAFQFTLGKICAGELPGAIEVWHEGKCGRCSRPLTTPESIARGIGPECLQKVGR